MPRRDPLNEYWMRRRANLIPDIHDSLARKGIWISMTLRSDKPIPRQQPSSLR